MSREAVWALHFGRTDGSAAAGALTGGDGAAILHTALTPSLGRGVRRFESGGGAGRKSIQLGAWSFLRGHSCSLKVNLKRQRDVLREGLGAASCP